MHDVSRSDVSWLIADSFRYSHIVLASVTYNLKIYPKMLNYLEDMKLLNLQKRTFAIIENDSWAPTSGALMKDFVDGMKQMDIINEDLTIISSLNDAKRADLDTIVDGLLDTM